MGFPMGLPVVSHGLVFSLIGNHACGELINRICPKIATTYGFVHSDNLAIICHNKKLAADLMEGNTFHYKVCILLPKILLIV